MNPIVWAPTDEDMANFRAIREALQAGSGTLSDLAILSHALRTAAASLGPTGEPAKGPPPLPEASFEAPLIGAEYVAGSVIDPEQLIIAHTDGACSGNPGPGGWAVVFGQGGKVVAEHSGRVPATTNNRMELTAVLEALRRSPAGVALEIVTDSQNVIGWLSKGWKRNDPQIAGLCREIDPLLVDRKVTFRWVKGHNGDPLNERVDRLAVAAISGR